MRTALPRWLEVLGGASLVIYPPAALVAFAGSSALSRRRVAWLWLVPWGPLLVVALFAFASGRGAHTLAQAAVGLLAGLVVAGRRRWILAGLLAGLSTVLVAGTVEKELTRALWTPNNAAASASQLARGLSRVSGDEPSWTRNGVGLIEKSWRLPDSDGTWRLTFDVRALSGEGAWQWYTNSPTTRQMRLVDNGTSFTRFEGLERYVARRLSTGAPLGGSRVRAELELRTTQPLPTVECAFQIRTFEPSFSECSGLTPTGSWQAATVEVTFPAEIEQDTFEVALRDLAADQVDVRDLTVSVWTPSGWRAVGPAEPTGVTVRVPLRGVHAFDEPALTVVPTDEWRTHSLEIDPGLLGDVRSLTALLQVEGGTVVELRGIELASPTRRAAPDASQRADLWYGDPNQAGHNFASAGLLAQSLSRVPAVGLAAWMSTLAVQTLPASRAALAAVLLGGTLLAVNTLARRAGVLVMIALLGLLALVLSTGGVPELPGRLFDLSDENSVGRVDIWRGAAEMMLSRPLTGVESFSDAWVVMHPASTATTPTHAHNVWLQLGAVHGLPGLIGGLWLAGGLCMLAWRRGRWRALFVVLPVLAMNVWDATLLTAGVMLPLIAAINVPGSDPNDERRSPGLRTDG